MAESYVLFIPIHLSPEGLSVLGICTMKDNVVFIALRWFGAPMYWLMHR